MIEVIKETYIFQIVTERAPCEFVIFCVVEVDVWKKRVWMDSISVIREYLCKGDVKEFKNSFSFNEATRNTYKNTYSVTNE